MMFLLKNFFRLNLWTTMRLRHKDHSRPRRGIAAWRGTSVELAKSSVIESGEGRLQLNRKWSKADKGKTLLVLRDHAKLVSSGNFDVYSGASIYVNEKAELCLGRDGYMNNNCRINAFQRVEIGDRVIMGEECYIRDSDDHAFKDSTKPVAADIHIGNHVWMGARVTVLKGVTIGDGSVVAAGSVVCRDIPPHCLAAGTPARVIKTNIEWK